MRRSASEIISELETRIARLERKASPYRPDGYDAYETGESERPLDIFESRSRDDERWRDSVSTGERADKQIKSILNSSRIKYTNKYGRFIFADKRTLVKALEALGESRSDARILGERGTDLQGDLINLFGKSYEVAVPDLEDEQYEYYLVASY
jgi:hypothetical protein